jgi:hypothetical protein
MFRCSGLLAGLTLARRDCAYCICGTDAGSSICPLSVGCSSPLLDILRLALLRNVPSLPLGAMVQLLACEQRGARRLC